MEEDLNKLYMEFTAHKSKILKELYDMERLFPAATTQQAQRTSCMNFNYMSKLDFYKATIEAVNSLNTAYDNINFLEKGNLYRTLYKIYENIIRESKLVSDPTVPVKDSILFYTIVENAVCSELDDKISKDEVQQFTSLLEKLVFGNFNVNIREFVEIFSDLLHTSVFADESRRGMLTRFVTGLNLAISRQFSDKDIMALFDTDSIVPLVYALLVKEVENSNCVITNRSAYDYVIVGALTTLDVPAHYLKPLSKIIFDYIVTFMLKENPKNNRLDLPVALLEFDVKHEDLLPFKIRLLYHIKLNYMEAVDSYFSSSLVRTTDFFDSLDKVARLVLSGLRKAVFTYNGYLNSLASYYCASQSKKELQEDLQQRQDIDRVFTHKDIISVFFEKMTSSIDKHIYFNEFENIVNLFYHLDSFYISTDQYPTDDIPEAYVLDHKVYKKRVTIIKQKTDSNQPLGIISPF